MEFSNIQDTPRWETLKLLAFYDIARRANLTNRPDLRNSPVFQKAEELYKARKNYLSEAYGSEEAVNDYLKLHLEGALAAGGKRFEDVWAEFAPESLKRFPLAAGSL